MRGHSTNPVALTIGSTTIVGSSISGVATWITVPSLGIMFDAGDCPLEAVPMNAVLVTHSHEDHAGGLMRHTRLRQMMGMEPAKVFVPIEAAQGLMGVAHATNRAGGDDDARRPDMVPVWPGERLALPRRGTWVRTFQVHHRAPSLAFTVGETKKVLRAEFRGLPNTDIAALVKGGTVVNEAVDTALVTYFGDCTTTSLGLVPAAWDARVVISECTYVEDEDEAAAEAHMHVHLNGLVDFLARTPAPSCKGLVLKHFSLKSHPDRIRELVAQKVPESWKGRVHLLLPDQVA